MNIPLVDLKTQYRSIQEEVDSAVLTVLSNCDFIGGAAVRRFEQAFAAYCGAKECVGLANGTDALYVALKALNIGPGDEVITAANSFIATSEAITLSGARVVFVDINPVTYGLDVAQVRDKITARTKAIIAVHLYGQPADMDPILEIAREFDLKVIEDAAQAHGATYKGRKVGSLGDVACFSFYPGKNLGAYGDGGALVTNDVAVARRAQMIANHGRGVHHYDHTIEGINSRLDTLQAAILETKLKHLPEWTERRRAAAKTYNELLQGTEVGTPVEFEGAVSVFHLYVVRVPEDHRESLLSYLKSRGVQAGIHYPIALPNLRAYAYLGHSPSDFPQATKAAKEIISLPIYPELTEDQIIYVVAAVREYFAENLPMTAKAVAAGSRL